MDDETTVTLRSEVRAFLERTLPEGWSGLGALPADERPEFLDRWRESLRDAGYLGLGWPKEYGGAGLDVVQQSLVQQELARAGVPHLPWPADPFSFNLLGPTLLACGSEEQRRTFLPRIIDGTDRWCQGYSEPEAGSDLFAVRTKAVLDSDSWVLHGQKTWQTAGQHANWIFVLARTDAEAPKAKGLSFLLVPLDQEGVTVRPIRTMTGEAEFCEVFFDGARTAASHIVGDPGDGAKVAIALLGFERGTASASAYTLHRIELERLADLIRQTGQSDDVLVRQRLAECATRLEAIGLMGRRVLAEAASGRPPGPEASLLKLCTSEYHARLTELAVDVLGADAAVLEGEGSVAHLGADPLGSPSTPAAWLQKFMVARAAIIYGGSSQIQRNTIGERVLGLPREPRPTPARSERRQPA